MNDKLKSVLDKVTKLRALAANAGTQAEAEAAAAQVETLIAKYQISEAEIEAQGAAQVESVRAETDPLHVGARLDKWIGILSHGLAKDHGCGVVWTGEHVRIAGRPADIAIVRYLFAWLHLEIERLSARESGRAAKNAFKVGAAMGVLAAMRKSRSVEVRAAMPSASAAMALTNRADESMASLKVAIGGRFGSAGKASVSDRDALDRGIAAGSNLAARPAMGAAGGRPMLGS